MASETALAGAVEGEAQKWAVKARKHITLLKSGEIYRILLKQYHKRQSLSNNSSFW